MGAPLATQASDASGLQVQSSMRRSISGVAGANTQPTVPKSDPTTLLTRPGRRALDESRTFRLSSRSRMALDVVMGVASKKGATMAMRRARWTATMVLLVAALTSAGPASARVDTLAQGAMNLVGTPLDLAMSPYTATSTFVRKQYAKSGQSTLAKVATTPVVGLVYIPSCTITAGAVR